MDELEALRKRSAYTAQRAKIYQKVWEKTKQVVTKICLSSAAMDEVHHYDILQIIRGSEW